MTSSHFGIAKAGFLQGIAQVASNRSFLLLLAAWSLSGALIQAWATFIDTFLDGRYSDGNIGHLGFAANLARKLNSLLSSHRESVPDNIDRVAGYTFGLC